MQIKYNVVLALKNSTVQEKGAGKESYHVLNLHWEPVLVLGASIHRMLTATFIPSLNNPARREDYLDSKTRNCGPEK